MDKTFKVYLFQYYRHSLVIMKSKDYIKENIMKIAFSTNANIITNYKLYVSASASLDINYRNDQSLARHVDLAVINCLIYLFFKNSMVIYYLIEIIYLIVSLKKLIYFIFGFYFKFYFHTNFYYLYNYHHL